MSSTWEKKLVLTWETTQHLRFGLRSNLKDYESVRDPRSSTSSLSAYWLTCLGMSPPPPPTYRLTVPTALASPSSPPPHQKQFFLHLALMTDECRTAHFLFEQHTDWSRFNCFRKRKFLLPPGENVFSASWEPNSLMVYLELELSFFNLVYLVPDICICMYYRNRILYVLYKVHYVEP